ncbi:MAG: YtxH domain-containing protein [Chloroflexota bacterium]
MKNKILSFLVGSMCGLAVGAVVTLLLTPASGKDLQSEMKAHWQRVLEEAQKAREETQKQLEDEFNQMGLL